MFLKKNDNCPLCKGESDKIIYYGLPMRFCKNDTCCCMFGFWDLITQYFPYNGVVMTYEGPYLYVLWHWLLGRDDT